MSQVFYSNMPVYKGMPSVNISVYKTHEEYENIKNSKTQTPAALKLELGDHSGTHVDALSHMSRDNFENSIDKMPLSMFYTFGICLDFSNKKSNDFISAVELENYCIKNKIEINPGDTVLIYTDHYRRTYGTDNWKNGPGITPEAAVWLGQKKIAAFGVETMSPGIPGFGNKEIHQICGKMGFTHYENLINLNLLVGKGKFRFIAFPLKIKGGTASPVRAVAVFE